MEINRERKHQMFSKQVMKAITGEDVEVMIPIGEYSIGELELEMNMCLYDIARNQERVTFLQKQIDVIMETQIVEVD